jgi:hypothetical protein
MRELLDNYLNQLDLEKMYYETLAKYNSILEDFDILNELAEDLPSDAKVSDVTINYKDTSIHLVEDLKKIYVNFDLYVGINKIGYYKGEFTIEGMFIDDFLVIF